MQANEIIQLMQQNRQPDLELLPKLDALISEYPWCSIAYQLRLKVLKTFDEELFISLLPVTAAHTVNRGQLYSYLFIEKPLAEKDDDLDPIFYYQPDEIDIPTPETEENEVITNDKEENSIIPIEVVTDYFALETENENATENKESNEDLLEKFISANPKIIPRKEPESEVTEIMLANSTEGIASESLAEIYIEQKFYDKALAVYKELGLQNPKKRAYFAALIKKVKEETK
ncbi:MAG: hypothetical protein LBG19_07085 [Prevotellaceae bacterium]|jgi:tetratricopeptide (TPR) repeat protein|nr:hypothetical protein [Prevotellaceae bacterium]